MAPNPSGSGGPTSVPEGYGNGGLASQHFGKKKKHRAGKKRRNRRQSFAAPPESLAGDDDMDGAGPSAVPESTPHGSSFYRIKENNSSTSLESAALLDHRRQSSLQPRRGSTAPQLFPPRPSDAYGDSPSRSFRRSKLGNQHELTDSDEPDEDDDHTPLMSTSQRDIRGGYGGLGAGLGIGGRPSSRPSSNGKGRRDSRSTVEESQLQRRPPLPQYGSGYDSYDVNNPPSVPGSPVMGPGLSHEDVMMAGDLEHGLSHEESRSKMRSRDVLINIDEEEEDVSPARTSRPRTPDEAEDRWRRTGLSAPNDVCFPMEGMSELGEEDFLSRTEAESGRTRIRRRRRRWPDLNILNVWSQEEKEQRLEEEMRSRKVSEPIMINGRLRPQKRMWHREADDAPYRFTYFNEDFENTIHSQTISGLLQEGQSFRNLFIPERPILEDSSDGETDTDEEGDAPQAPPTREPTPQGVKNGANNGSRLSEVRHPSSGDQTRSQTPAPAPAPSPKPQEGKTPRLGPRPSFWLDVLSPTDAEMKVITKAFSIHPLTAEDIMMQEAREKVELFRHYYFINYRTFEQDQNSEDYLDPVNLYVIVFREGVISFHFSMTPHPANVRRRIRQLQDYLILSPDWISYALIDDVTDAYAPLIERIEEEVDDIDEAILRLHSEDDQVEQQKQKSSQSFNNPKYEKMSSDGRSDMGQERSTGGDMLLRVGTCRKKVMTLYRLLGNKADVIKGFAKRCNEQWDVAPRSEIGLYLGDIQDHIVTMTGNLSHYENLLSRAHSNYLAQINIRMNERQEKTADVLGKLTVMGTIVLPMNVVTGIWGMNCLVPGQDIVNLNWFWGITGSLVLFGLTSYFIAKRVYGIV